MVSKCANPACSAPFRFLHEGKLFRIETQPESSDRNAAFQQDPSPRKPARHVEFFWLCGGCSVLMTLAVEKEMGVTIRPRMQALRAAS